MKTCEHCGGIKATEHLQMIAGTPCQCPLGAVPGSVRIPHKCPCCDGTGLTLRPPWVAGDAPGWATTTPCETYPCKACTGRGILWDTLNDQRSNPAPTD